MWTGSGGRAVADQWGGATAATARYRSILALPPGASSTVRGGDPLTWNRYGGMLLEEAQRLNIDPAVAIAV
ncbi:hypothetical protein [Candidatus Amarolinea dominans]|uniref:hypothetical protein n=1 Tax=Candidatus Amarolinea dominans TaxID=3140696 RepID=UPI001DE636EC|nr:hypothetical protein [Anaerolineae bacterium]